MHVHRTKRGRVLEYWALFFLSVRPYRCGKCRLRFYGPKKFMGEEESDDAGEPVAADSAAESGGRHSESSRSSRR